MLLQAFNILIANQYFNAFGNTIIYKQTLDKNFHDIKLKEFKNIYIYTYNVFKPRR